VAGEDVVVAKGFRRVDRDQQFLMAPDMREWLPQSDPVWLVISVVEGLDTAALRGLRKTGGVGRAAYDPVMLVTLLIWAWAQGQRSSRRIERLCSRDVAFRIVCAGDVPDHVTISRFRKDCAPLVEDLFTQVLVLCARVGMGELGTVALDGVKIASNASLSANRTETGLRKAAAEQAVADAAKAAAEHAAAEHAAADAAEDAMFGPQGRGDELPEELRTPGSRAARIAQALAELTEENTRKAEKTRAAAERRQARKDKKTADRAARLEAFEQRRPAGGATMGAPPAEIRVEVLTRNWEAARAARQAEIDRYDRGGGKGRRPGPVDEASMVKRVRAALDRAIADRAAAEAEAALRVKIEAETPSAAGESKSKSWTAPKRNITDPESRLMQLRGGGWLQGYNCQAVTSADGVIIATGVGNNPNDTTTFTDMVDKAVTAARLVDAARRPATTPTGIGMLLADNGYLSESNLAHPGPDRLIATAKGRDQHKAATENPAVGPVPEGATPLEANAHRMRTPEGHERYKQRSHIAETPFGHAKHNLGFRRFTSRGLTRATAEFAFHALVHNLFKAIGAGTLTPHAI
jgi:transposase